MAVAAARRSLEAASEDKTDPIGNHIETQRGCVLISPGRFGSIAPGARWAGVVRRRRGTRRTTSCGRKTMGRRIRRTVAFAIAGVLTAALGAGSSWGGGPPPGETHGFNRAHHKQPTA